MQIAYIGFPHLAVDLQISMDFLNLPGWKVLREQASDDYHLLVECFSKTDKCPECSSARISRNGSRPALFRDLPAHGKRVVLEIERQRYICGDCRKSFSQSLPEISETRDATNRLIEYIGEQSTHRSFAAVAENVGAAENMVRSVFLDYARELEKTRPADTPVWLGIDEIHLSKKFHCVLSNIKDKRIFDFLPDRQKKSVARRVSSLKSEIIELVTIDMTGNFYEVAHALFPRAAVVIDKFHVVRMVNIALNDVRKEIGKSLSKQDRNTLMNKRFRLLTHRKNLKGDFDRMELDSWLEEFPMLGKAYWVKEEFYGIYESTDKFEARGRLWDWQMAIPREVEPYFTKIISALKNWETEILAFFDHNPRVTNAYTESLNNLIKHINGDGRGYSFDVLRAKILYGTDASKYRRGVFKPSRENWNAGNIDTFSRISWNEPKIKSEVEPKTELFYLGADIDRLIELYENGEF